MFTRCIFCHGALGTNEALAVFPVGRRLAFDPARGRLWVVCRQCERWNLSPLDERWEAIEGAERLYRDTRRRASTDQIGLARLPDGTELVRVGRPQRPEFAAWRYGDQFGRRRRGLATAGGIAAAVGIGATVATAGAAIPLLSGMLAFAPTAFLLAASGVRSPRSLRQIHVPLAEDATAIVTVNELQHVRLVEQPDAQGWGIALPYAHRYDPRTGRSWTSYLNLNLPGSLGTATLTGAVAHDAATRLLPLVNGRGARQRQVQAAVSLLEESPEPTRFFAHAAGRVREWGAQQSFGDTGSLRHLPAPVRLALEMAAHETAERQALEGELAALERAWQEAEEIAAIADDLLLPTGVRARLARLKQG